MRTNNAHRAIVHANYNTKKIFKNYMYVFWILMRVHTVYKWIVVIILFGASREVLYLYIGDIERKTGIA